MNLIGEEGFVDVKEGVLAGSEAKSTIDIIVQ